MITISATILAANQKKDGTWNVKIRIWHNGKPAYIDTNHFVVEKQLSRRKDSKTLILKDTFIIDRIAPQLKNYRDWVSTNNELLSALNAKQVKERLLEIDTPREEIVIDFLKFCNEFLTKKLATPKASSAKTLITVRNSLIDYFKTPIIPIIEINYNFLKKYEEFLRSSRELTRNNHGGKSITYTQKGLSDAGLHNHMRDLRLLFNEARNQYNDEDLGILKIPHYPFKKYKVGTPPITQHRDRPVHEIIKIRDCNVQLDSRAELARDLCMLSIYLLGMNAADLYELKPFTSAKRINYNRAKTRGKRKDNAFFSVKVIKEAIPLLKKYAGKLNVRYANTGSLNAALDKGLKTVSEITGITDIDFYDMRHCIGTWARRKCGYSKDDVAEALNQTDRTVTDIYIAQDWSLIDRIQEDIIALLKNPNSN
ncbi:site-specific integrase [Pedobacter fastidiosus]|uniref:Site-specific integrase n=1 Tax=Pedobacter fastidiosus TaxID=2765361 RepID=A0ABR7KVK9_9SPHI|nr:site-specific integrase [Pedobacter fastidiosus]MBC6112063.1 site-specific integrase [Pedobacter fastidiosus]